jgi:hypothetical protein
LVEQVVERALRNQPKPHDRGGQPALGQDEPAENKQRGAERAARACARQSIAAPSNRQASVLIPGNRFRTSRASSSTAGAGRSAAGCCASIMPRSHAEG